MSVKIKLHGSLQHVTGKDRILLKLAKPVTLRELVKKITKSIEPKLREALIDPELLDPRTNMLILINGKEVSVLNGLDTEIHADDEVIFIPVSHGG